MKKLDKQNSVIVAGACAAGRFARGIVGVATLGVSELIVGAGKGLAGLFKRNDNDPTDDFDEFDDYDEFDDFDEEVTPAVQSYDCSSADMAEAARVVAEGADAEIDAMVDRAMHQNQ